MKLLEKDIHEKQDTIVNLRRQLEDIKQINLEMYRKLQVIFHEGFVVNLVLVFLLFPPIESPLNLNDTNQTNKQI